MFICKNCGSTEYKTEEGFDICLFCGSKYKKEITESSISLNNDVKRLLEKINKDPINKEKYIDLILEIDPSNREYIKYM